jgi:hypothetical protein
MHEDRAQALVDLALLGAGAVAAIWILKTPPLRRATWRTIKSLVFTAAPAWLWQQTARAWAESAHSPRLRA